MSFPHGPVRRLKLQLRGPLLAAAVLLCAAGGAAAQNVPAKPAGFTATNTTTDADLAWTDTDALPATGRVALTPLCTGKTGSACWLEAKNKPGCHIWNTSPKPDETVTWTGQCVGGKLSGKGRATWRFREDGAWASSYEEGPYVEGKSGDGHWVVRFADADGEVWEGSLSEGVLNGLWVRRGSRGRDWTCMVGGENSSDIGKCGIEEVDRRAKAKRRTELRSGPSPDYERTGTVASGDRVRVTGEAERKWARIETAGGDGGFVLASALAKAESGEPAKRERRRSGKVFRDCPDCPEMVMVPAGSFMMGARGTERVFDDARPLHRVTIRKPFAVGKYEVTRGEFARFVSATGHDTPSMCGRSGLSWRYPGFEQGDRDPVVCVSWGDAKAYVRWLSKKTGKRYRLLSEAEWEYAARAGTTTRYSWGDGIGGNRANCDGCGSRWDNKRTAPTGSFAANAFGLHDMHGNVWEWVEDCWHDGYVDAPGDGRAWVSGDCSARVVRGGSWASKVHKFPGVLRVAYRDSSASGLRMGSDGFRVARTLMSLPD